MRKWAGVGFAALITAFFAYTIVGALDWRFDDKLFPLSIGGPMLVIAVYLLVREVVKALQGGVEEQAVSAALPGPGGAGETMAATEAEEEVQVDPAAARRRVTLLLAWFAASFLMLWLLGFREGLPVFVFLFLRFYSKESWIMSFAVSVAAGLVMHQLFGGILSYPWAAPQISLWFDFDWPGI